MKLGHTLMVATALIAVAGCAKKPPKELPPAPQETPAAEAPPPAQMGPVPGSEAHFLANVASDRVFFDTDKSDIDAPSQATLRSQAAYLRQYPNVRVTIEGHCDERGTREYNLALGERRANAAKNYLASLGIDPSRLNTISYGKERPEALGSDEASWAKNRRAVTVVIQ
ncbi:putative peptidoglycan-associated lipoprotein [Sphingomonas changbaiensis NBRC 104936]|uniref:Peptidoglycan-associated lipoprotein n=1 Tax=Sphingomonas changbaiensis NBRC 104936 TaxID=1219043 RepID=A0A0E9MS81_9SPHN|nr:peptidoglycan-associated lipoprotein Pal [Sphingomonas changbaiensis]GAO39980.1 putative peptidoglycan-associated lipoprotein [Sphingomonas changbaiensis NBRC 104936]